ncbi:MAG: glycoside hydrolase family 5 protein [Deltaproteobacteria bacterium]|nr:glycoside hydrolase family 5 protein [Deltaproteobacteria bacterium]
MTTSWATLLPALTLTTLACVDGARAPVGAVTGAFTDPVPCQPDEIDLHAMPPRPTFSTPPKATPPAMCAGGSCLWRASDDIFGAQVPREDSWYVVDGFVFYGDQRIILKGVNWFGLETTDNAPHGLWVGRDIGDFLDQMVALGFNAIRLPVSPWSIYEGTPTSDWATEVTGATTGRELLDMVLAESGQRGIYIMLDHHTCDPPIYPRAGRPQDCSNPDIEAWHEDLRTLAELALDHPHVFGIDLFNEPYALAWGEWADLASAAGREVLEVNPRVLVLVQGAHSRSSGGEYDLVFGENLMFANTYPVDLPKSRLVFAPHAYGPELWPLNYVVSSQFPAILPHVWDLHFGHLLQHGYGLVLGEFGGYLDDSRVPRSVEWQTRFVQYLQDRGIESWFYWSWNPNSGDTGGLLEDDWETPVQRKLDLLAPLIDAR